MLVFFSSAAFAWQDEPEPGHPPVIPETEVEAEQNAPPQNVAQDFSPPSVLEGTIFTSPPANGYRANSTTTGTLIDVPTISTPLTVDVVPQAVIRDQQALNFNDITRNIPSAFNVGDGLFQDKIFLRGLEVRSRDFRKNGFLDPTYTPRDFANVERVEIIKGPASVMYGSAGPSGTVNLITKKPLDALFNNFNYQFGGFGTSRYNLDLNGRATRNGKVLYRLNAAYENSNSYRNFANTNRYIIAPAVTFLPGPNTIVTWEAELVQNRRIGDRGIPAVGGNPLFLPVSTYIGEPANDFLFSEDYRSSMVLQHQFDNNWTYYLGASTVFYQFPASQTYAVAPLGPPGTTDFLRFRQNDSDNENATSLMSYFAGDASLGLFNHKLLFGTEQVYYDSKSRFFGGLYPPIDAANPVYTNPPLGALAFDAQFPVFRQTRHGYFLQDLTEISPYLQFLSGVRFDDVSMTFDRTVGPTLVHTKQHFTRTSPRVGVVLQEVPGLLSTYFNYSRSFNPPGGDGFPFNNTPPKPELGESFELGQKALLLDNLSFYAAGYYATLTNVPFATFGVGGPEYFQAGQQRSRGFESQLIGNVTNRLSVIGNYAYTDTRLTDPNNPAFFGQRNRNVPYNQASLWTRFSWINDGWQQFGTSLGYVYTGQRTANLAADVFLPSYSRWDCGLYYNLGRWNATVYMENLFNAKYAVSSIDQFQIMPGAPFNARASVGVTY